MARPKKNTNTQALADKMRKAVLQAAIEGKLTQQNLTKDGHARDLLADIEAEKQRLIKAGEIKRSKTLSPITEEEKPFDIPDSWEWVRLDQLSIYIQRGRSPKYSTIEEIPVISQKCVQWESFSIELAKFIDPETKEKYQPERFLQDRDLLWNSTGLGTVGRVTRYKSEANEYGIAVADSHVTVVRVLKKYVLPEYVEMFIASPVIQQNIEDICSGSTKQKELATGTVKETILPLPPLAEQQRIVKKLKEVLAQIDSLQTDEDELHRLQLAFPNQMQAALLQAAIEGKLTQQNLTKDGHARDLLADIEAEKQRLIKAGEIKRSKTLSPITEEEKPFDIPDNWEWVRLGDVVIVNPRNKAEDNLEAAFVPMKLVEAGYKNIFDFEVRKWMSIKTGYTHFAENDVVFAKITPCFQNLKSAVISNIPNGIGAGTTEFHVLRNFNDHIDIEYLLYFVKNPTFINDGVATFTGTAGQQRIGTDFVKEYLLPLPPLAEQRRIVDLLDQALPEIQTLKEI